MSPKGNPRTEGIPSVNQARLSVFCREFWPDVGELETEKRFPR